MKYKLWKFKTRYEIRFRIRDSYGLLFKDEMKYKDNFKMRLLLEMIRELRFKAFAWKAKKHNISYWYLPI